MTSSTATAISLALLGWFASPARAQEFKPRELPIPPPIEIKSTGPPAVNTDDAPPTPASFVQENPVLQRTAAQAPARGKAVEDDLDFTISTELPGADRQFRRESELQMFERIRQEAHKRGVATKTLFPVEKPLTRESYTARSFAPMKTTIQAMYVTHGRLYFEQPNLERQGWDLGILTPVVSLGHFYYDAFLLPYHMWTRPCDCCDSSAGKCLPGDPTPLYWYWEEFSWTGLAGQAGAMVGGCIMFP